MGRTEELSTDLTARGMRRRRRQPRPWWRTRTFRRRVRGVLVWIAIAVLAFIALCSICFAIVAPSVIRAASDGRIALNEGSAAVLRKDGPVARTEFSAAQALFDGADRRLRSPFAWPLRVAPVASTHMRVARGLSQIGASISRSGVAIADAMQRLPGQQLTFTKGKVDLNLVRAAERALHGALRSSPAMTKSLEQMPRGWVVGPLSAPRQQALEELPPILEGVRKADAALAGLPSLLGGGGSKRYLVAFSNLSELRGSGGLFGYVTALTARSGRLTLDAFSGRPTDVFPVPGKVGLTYPPWFPPDFRTQAQIFQNINMTTDFPTVGSFVLKTAATKAGHLDGVISVDPVGIGAVLALTGPIRVPSWPAAITAGNIGRIAMHDVYIAIPKDTNKREAFFAQLVRTAFGRLTSTKINLAPKTLGTFDLAVRGAHFRMYSQHANDEATIDRIGASGAVGRASKATDVLSVVSENATGNKADYFLKRDIRYAVRLDPRRRDAVAVVNVTFRNTAPTRGLPNYIIGSPLGLPRGTNRQIAMLVRSSDDRLDKLLVDGNDVKVVISPEANLRAYRTTVDVPPHGGRSQLVALSGIPHAFYVEGSTSIYRLHVMPQAIANPDFVQVAIATPAGWTVAGQTSFFGDLTQDVILEVRLKQTLRAKIVERMILDPLHLAGRILGRIF